MTVWPDGHAERHKQTGMMGIFNEIVELKHGLAERNEHFKRNDRYRRPGVMMGTLSRSGMIGVTGVLGFFIFSPYHYNDRAQKLIKYI